MNLCAEKVQQKIFCELSKTMSRFPSAKRPRLDVDEERHDGSFVRRTMANKRASPRNFVIRWNEARRHGREVSPETNRRASTCVTTDASRHLCADVRVSGSDSEHEHTVLRQQKYKVRIWAVLFIYLSNYLHILPLSP